MERDLKFMRRILSFAIAIFVFSPILLWARSADPCPYQLDEDLWASLAKGNNIQSFSAKKIAFQLFTRDKITPELKGTLNTKGFLKGTYPFKGINVQLILDAVLTNGSIDTRLRCDQLDTLLVSWMNKYQIPRPWRFKTVKLEQLSFDEGKGFEARWRVKSKMEFCPLARMSVSNFKGPIEDVTGVLDRYQDFVEFIENDERSRIILQNNKSGIPPFLDYQGDTQYPLFIARHPMHVITWDEKKDTLQFDYLDVLTDVEKIPEIKGMLGEKEVKNFVGEDHSRIRIKGQGNQKEGFEIAIFKPDEKKGLMVKLKGRKVVETEELKP